MKALNSLFERLKSRDTHRFLALALVFLLALNILAAALPLGGFGNVQADSPYNRDCIATLEVRSGTSAKLQLTLGSAPVLQDYPDPQKELDELSFWVAIDGELFDYYYDPYVYMSYTDGVLYLNVYSELDSTINIYPKDGTEITALSLVEDDSSLPTGVTSLEFTNIDTLTALDVSGVSELEELVLFGLPSLAAVDASDCSLESLVITSDCAAITSLDLSGNSLNYGNLPTPSSQYTSYSYASQSDIEAPACAPVGGTIDLSECGLSSYTWYFSDGTPVTSGITGTGKLGVVTVGAELADKTIYCAVSNSNYPDLPQLKATPIHVVDNLQFCYSDCKDSVLSFSVSDSDAQITVYNNGSNITSLLTTTSENGATEYRLDLSATDAAGCSGTVYVVSDSPVVNITLQGDYAEDVNVDACTALESLTITGGDVFSDVPLESIDLSNNTALTSLKITNSKISDIDLSANTALKSAKLSDNRLGSLTLPAGLMQLDVNNNPNLGSLDSLEACKSTLKALNAGGCSLTSADFTGFSSLAYLSLPVNELTEITLPENAYKYIDLSSNAFTFETLPAYPLTITDSDFVYSYETQAKVEIGSSYKVGDTIDLSSQMKSSAPGDTVTAYLHGGSGYTVSSTDGVFVVPEELAEKSIYFTLESKAFKELTRYSHYAEIAKAAEVIVSTNAAVRLDGAGTFSFSILSTAPVYVDWGGGVRTQYTPSGSDYSLPIEISGTVADSNGVAAINIATTGAVSEVDFSRAEGRDEVSVIAANLTQWKSLETLRLSGNSLESLDVSSNSDLKFLDISDNSFTFASLPDFDGESYVYSPQDIYPIKQSVKAGETINLTAVGAETYTWYNADTGDAVTPKTSNNGVFTFGSEHINLSLYCKMENNNWDGLEILTNDTTVQAADDTFDSASVILKTSLANGTRAAITISCDDSVYIDWGNGVLVSAVTSSTDCVTVEKAVLGDTVKIYTHGTLTLLSATDMEITAADVSNAADLETLDLSGNKLSSIDLSKNTRLTTLDLSDNSFIFPELPAVSAFTDYDYIPQAFYPIPTVKGTGASMSALTALNTEGATMGHVWYKKNSSGEDTLLVRGTDKDYMSLGDGKFSFNSSVAGETVYCVVTNSAYPGLKIRTTDMLILAGGGLAMTDTTGTIKSLTIAEGSTCKTTGGTTIPAGDLDGTADADDAVLTFKAKPFTNTSEVTSSTLFSLVKSQLSTFDSSDRCHYIYDFSFVDSSGAEISSFDGSVNITLSYPTAVASTYSEYDFYLFHYITSGTKKGTMEKITVTPASDGLTFTATSFSPYILVYQADPEKDPEKNESQPSSTPNNTSSTPDTGDHSEGNARLASVILWVSLIVMAVIAAVIIRKRSALN